MPFQILGIVYNSWEYLCVSHYLILDINIQPIILREIYQRVSVKKFAFHLLGIKFL